MTQRSNHSQIAIAKPQGQALVLRAALVTLATAALLTVLVLITGSISAEYGFA
jgi:multisubunit Na+/H+ antiporter MnhC subunit